MFQIPMQMLFVAIAGWVNREQQAIIDYLKEENHIFRELHGKKRLRFNDDQRRRLAAKGKALGGNLRHRHAGYDSEMASRTRGEEIRWKRKAPAWSTSSHGVYQEVDDATGPGKRALGIYEDPGSVATSGPPCVAIDDPAHPQGAGDRTGT